MIEKIGPSCVVWVLSIHFLILLDHHQVALFIGYVSFLSDGKCGFIIIQIIIFKIKFTLKINFLNYLTNYGKYYIIRIS